MTPESLRKQIRSIRRQQSTVLSNQLSQQISNRAITSFSWQNEWNVAFYSPHQGEVSCFPILEYALSLGCSCYLPTLDPNQPHHLIFLRYRHEAPLRLNRYGIQEMADPNAELCCPKDLDLVFVPLVAFDEAGHRLGMGGGYYDRTFQFKQEQAIQGPVWCGLAYDFQQVHVLDSQSWDIPLDHLVTETRHYQFKKITTG